MFLYLCVILFPGVGGWGGFPACITGRMTGGGGVCIQGVCAQGQSASGVLPPWGVCIGGGGQTTPHPSRYTGYKGYNGIQSRSGRYPSYWNAFLYVILQREWDWDHIKIPVQCTFMEIRKGPCPFMKTSC